MKSKYLVIILAFILILCVNTVSAADNSSILSDSPESNVLAVNEGNYIELKDLNDSNITQDNTVLKLANDDEYYSENDVVGGLNVTKVTEKDNFTDVGKYLTFVVNITNVNNVTLHNITIIEEVPKCFDSTFEAELKVSDADVTVDGNKITYSKELNPNEHIEVYIKFQAIKAGSYINNITVTSSETAPVIVQSNRFNVYDPKINFTITAVNKTVIVGNQAVFLINVTNTGDRPLRPEEISVNDYWPEELIYDHIENVTGNWTVIDYFFPVFALNSILEVNKSVNFKIYFNTTEIGKYENRANVFFHLGTIYEANDNISVDPKIPIEISVGNVTAHPGDNITIPVDVTIIGNETSGDLLMSTAESIIGAGNSTLFNGNLTVTLPDGSTQNVEIIGGKGNIAWTIPMGYEGDYLVTASFEGNNIYLPANGTGIITVVKIPTEVSIENITAKSGSTITIPVNLNTEDGVPINGNVTVTLPDGTTKSVEITNGTGETTWTVPGDYDGDYNYSVKYDGNSLYLPSNNTAIITVPPKVPVEIIVGKITAKPGDKVSIPIDVITQDGSLFNGNVTVTLPDGTTKVVEIIDGKGSVDWTIPDNYDGTYSLSVTFDGDYTYLPANGTGSITVIPDTPDAPVNPETPDAPVNPETPDAPVNPETPEKPSVKSEVPMDDKATGNPVIALLMVLALLGIGIKRKN